MNKIFELDAEIFGRVQGVGLRAMIKNYADENSLSLGVYDVNVTYNFNGGGQSS